MRILYIQPAETFGGAERQAVVHIKHLRLMGHDVIPFVGPGRPIEMALRDAGIDDYVHSTNLPNDPPRPLSAWDAVRHGIKVATSWRSASRDAVTSVLRRRGVDLVFASRPVGWAIGSVAARRLSAPVVWRAGTMPSTLGHELALRTLARVFRPQALITNAVALNDRIAPVIGAPSFVIRNGVDVERFLPARTRPRFRAELGIDPDALVVGVSARPHPDKGFDALATAAARLGRAHPTFRMLIAGDDGWRETLQRRFAAEGLGQRVTFLGHVRDIENFYRSCDVVALASKDNGEVVSNALLEAMAMERPIAATRVGGMHEVIIPGVNGLLSPAGDVDAFTQNLDTLLRDHTMRRRMGLAGRATIVRSFSELTVVEQLASVLGAVTDNSRRQPRLDRPIAHEALAAL
jgi:glycosyltransferase involved in cell wall biosynthesis